MSGYKNRFGVSRCCCSCADCCNGDAPSEYDVTLSIGDSDCGNCDSLLSGAYTLSPGTLPCGWYFERDWPDNTEICRSDYYNPWWLISQYIQLRIRCSGPTHYQLDAWMIVQGSAYFTIPGWFPGIPGITTRMTIWNRWWWSQLVEVSEWPCTGAVNYSIPFAYQHWAANDNGPWREFDSVYPHYCDGAASLFEITAVP